jgi:hypothetical protein
MIHDWGILLTTLFSVVTIELPKNPCISNDHDGSYRSLRITLLPTLDRQVEDPCLLAWYLRRNADH